jgi:hypothetical protein
MNLGSTSLNAAVISAFLSALHPPMLPSPASLRIAAINKDRKRSANVQ